MSLCSAHTAHLWCSVSKVSGAQTLVKGTSTALAVRCTWGQQALELRYVYIPEKAKQGSTVFAAGRHRAKHAQAKRGQAGEQGEAEHYSARVHSGA